MVKQAEIFSGGEGDSWFRRNRDHLSDDADLIDTDRLISALESFRPSLNSLVEVGCGNGIKLERMCRAFGASGVGIDPSTEAVAEGNARLEGSMLDVKLLVGTADSLPLPDASCDLLCFGFCLYLVDRTDLLRVVAEADRLLKPGGFLAVVDFDPLLPQRRSYGHYPGVFSYKQDYSQIFLASGLYGLVSKTSFSHAGSGFAEQSDERVALNILYREKTPYPDYAGK